MDADDDGYYCYACNEPVVGVMHALTRSRQRVHFAPGMNELETKHAECISYYCGPPCMERHMPSVMASEHVPIPVHPPGLGPVEACAVCKGPVDMTEFHLAYTKSEEDHRRDFVEVLESHEIAVVCNECAPGLVVAASVREPQDKDVPMVAEERALVTD